MTIKVALEHRTSYTFDRPVRVFPHVVRLRPAPHSRTAIEAYSLRVEPADHFVNWQQDAVGNFVYRLTFPNPTSRLTITVGLIADLKVINPFDFFIEDWAETWPAAGFSYPEPLADELKPYLQPVDEDGPGSGPGELAQAWARAFAVPEGTRTINFLVALNRRINADLRYSLRMEHGVQTPDLTLSTKVGSCRDFAWLLVSVAASAGSGRPIRVRIPGPADLRRQGTRRAVGPGRRLHRSSRVGRGLHPRRGLDRAGPDVGSVRRGGPYPAGRHAEPGQRGPDHRRRRAVRVDVGILQHRHPHPRGPACHAPLHRRGLGRPSRRSPAASTSGSKPATSGSPSAASPPSSRSTTRSTTSGPPPPTAHTSASSPPTWPPD